MNCDAAVSGEGLMSQIVSIGLKVKQELNAQHTERAPLL